MSLPVIKRHQLPQDLKNKPKPDEIIHHFAYIDTKHSKPHPIKRSRRSMAITCLLSMILTLGAPPVDRPLNKGDAHVTKVKKIGNFTRGDESYVIDNYTEVFLDGERSSFRSLPEGVTV